MIDLTTLRPELPQIKILDQIPEQRPEEAGVYYYVGDFRDADGNCVISRDWLQQRLAELMHHDSSICGMRSKLSIPDCIPRLSTPADRDRFFSMDINLIRFMPEHGTVVWGDYVAGTSLKTLTEVCILDMIGRAVAHLLASDLGLEGRLNPFYRFCQHLKATGLDISFELVESKCRLRYKHKFHSYEILIDYNVALPDIEHPVFNELKLLYGRDRYRCEKIS
jgi:hypothetical protein